MDDRNPLDVAIGAKLRELRIARDMSQEALAKAMNVTPDEIDAFEEGRARVSASALSRATKVFDVPVSTFYKAASAASGTARAELTVSDDAKFGHALQTAMFHKDATLVATLLGHWLVDNRLTIDASLIESWHQWGIVANTRH